MHRPTRSFLFHCPHAVPSRGQWLLVLLSICAGGARAQDGLELYGRLNAAAERTKGSDHPTADDARFSNYRSVIGIRGQLALEHQLTAIFQVEGGIALDTGVGSISNRDTCLGITGPFGTAFGGEWTLPYTSATASFDPFYPTTAGYMAIMGNGSASSTDNVIDRSAFDRRQQNVVQYWTPTFAGVSAKMAYGFGEAVVASTGAKPSLYSGSVTWATPTLSLTVASEVHRHYQAATTSDKASKVGATWQPGALRLSGVFEHLDYGTSSGRLTRNAQYLSAVYPIDDWTLSAGWANALDGRGSSAETVGHLRSGSHTGARQLTVGTEYSLGKRASVFVSFSRIQNGRDAGYDFAINPVGIRDGASPAVFATGLKINFCGAVLGAKVGC